MSNQSIPFSLMAEASVQSGKSGDVYLVRMLRVDDLSKENDTFHVSAFAPMPGHQLLYDLAQPVYTTTASFVATGSAAYESAVICAMRGVYDNMPRPSVAVARKNPHTLVEIGAARFGPQDMGLFLEDSRF